MLPLSVHTLKLSISRAAPAAPVQLGNLAQLEHLQLNMPQCESEGFRPMSRLTSLTALALRTSVE